MPSLDTFPLAVWLKYLIVFGIVAIMGPVILLFYQTRITNCSGNGYGVDTYLGQCASKTYGDFEHGLFGLKLNYDAIRHLETAQVVVLGHSHSMVAFSTASTRQYFKVHGLQFYNAALSGENSLFFDFLLSKLRLNAKVVIIDIAPFFIGDDMSSVGRFIVENPVRATLEYRIKQIWQFVHRYGCAALEPLRNLLCGSAFSTFRSIYDGWLIVDYTLAYGSPLPKIPVAPATISKRIENEFQIELARKFVSRHHLNAACIILTSIPTGYDLSALAQAMARALGASYINPVVDGLTTIDGAHLNESSATAWATKFWIEATPTIDRCLK